MAGDIMSGGGDLCFGKHLYHVKRTLSRPARGLGRSRAQTDVRGTYTDGGSARQAARESLFADGYDKHRPATFEVRESDAPPQGWGFGDDVYVHAVTLDGDVPTVAVETTENEMGLRRNGCRKLAGPLWYVLRTAVRSRAVDCPPTRICGVHPTHETARATALHCPAKDGTAQDDFPPSHASKCQEGRPQPEVAVVTAVDRHGDAYVLSVVKHDG